MSERFDQCMANAVAGGEISREDAARLKEEFDRLRAVKATGSSTTADEEAKKALAELLAAESAHEKRKARAAIRTIRRIEGEVKSWKSADGQADVARAAMALLENFGEARAGTGFSSVAGRERAILGQAHARMEAALHHFRRGALLGDKGRWNRPRLEAVVRELFGEDSGDPPAKAFARSWSDTAEWLRQRFNAAGGAIGKLEDWGLPQFHDPRALRRVGLAAWKDAIRPMLDITRMRHPLSGRPIGEKELDGVLEDIWRTIATEGWIDRQPARQRLGRGALANQRAEHRFLVFRDAAAWLQYQRDFGQGDPFAAMMRHLNAMAKDIAAMEILGPNPGATVEWLKQAIEREAQMKAAGQPALFSGGDRPLDRARRWQRRIDSVWGSIRGSLATPVDTRAANLLGAARAWLTAGLLGQAALSAISDIGFQRAARSFAFGRTGATARGIVAGFMPATRREAVEAGLILDSAQHVLSTQARYVGTLGGPEWANWLADRVLTVSGLTPWTQAGRHAFGLAFQIEMGKRVHLSFDALPEAIRRTLGRYGISPHEWDLIRKAPLHRKGEAAMLRPAEIAERIGDGPAERYLEMILQETEYAVPSSSHRARTALLDQNQPGTLWGEVLRSFAQFKSFGTVVMLLHGLRVKDMLGTPASRAQGAAYLAALIATTTGLGALAYQAKQVANGRDPAPMDDPKFWGAALLQGGGLGIYGDFLFADINRYGGGFAKTLAGPLFAKADDFWTLTAGNAVQLATGETLNFGKELARFSRGMVPGGNIWYLRLAMERQLIERLQLLADPEAAEAFRAEEKRWLKRNGQSFWWRPGEALPGRAPAIAPAPKPALW